MTLAFGDKGIGRLLRTHGDVWPCLAALSSAHERSGPVLKSCCVSTCAAEQIKLQG